MSMKEGMTPARQGETRLAEAEVSDATDANRPRQMTVAENVILTIKLLGGLGLLGAVLWGINLWTSVK